MLIGVVINPVSGAPGGERRGERRAAIAREVGTKFRVDLDVRVSEAPGHAVEIARGFAGAGAELVIAWGGDGTANEVAGPLIGTRTALGLVPAGSGDGLARTIGVPRDSAAALAAAIAGPTDRIDVGFLGDRHFLNIAGIGFDAAVAESFNRRGRRGISGYFQVGLGAVWSYRPRRYAVDLDDLSREGETFLLAFANGRQYGNGLTIAPAASLRDAQLDVVLVEGGSPWRQLWRARRLFFRQMAPAKGVTRARIVSARVAGEDLHAHVDGETFRTSGSLNVRVAPAALAVRGGAGFNRSLRTTRTL
jgi:YegS/Rv2252/BmrU family lipid kinase